MNHPAESAQADCHSQDTVIHHPDGPLAPKIPENLVPMSRACHAGEHDACEHHEPGGSHECRCFCHGGRGGL